MKQALIAYGTCISVLLLAYLLLSFNNECKHIYVSVRQPEVKVQLPGNSMIGIYVAPPSGKHEGDDLVCVKCFHLRKQILDYGEATQRLPWGLGVVDTLNGKYPIQLDSGFAPNITYSKPGQYQNYDTGFIKRK